MFGGIILGQNGQMALSLIDEARTVTSVQLYRDNNMLSVTTTDGEETFMTSEIDPTIAEPMRKNTVIHIGHVTTEQTVTREYTVPLIIT
jgi:hypothetical protein